MTTLACRLCGNSLSHTFCDLGMSPLSNAFLRGDQLDRMEPFYPLHVRVCDTCFLVQLPEFETPERIFSDYAYFSSFSDTWLAHAHGYVQAMSDRFGLDQRSRVVEIASNDGYLLRYFKERGVTVLGIEPAENVAREAQAGGIPTMVRFFNASFAAELAAQGTQADLLLGNNVLAHVPALNDFVAGMKIVLGPQGVITMEFPHLLRLMDEGQFDTIYHEHFSYFSLLTTDKLFLRHGLRVFDVEELPTHGGSLRIYATHAEREEPPASARLQALRRREFERGMQSLASYAAFGEKVRQMKRALLNLLIRLKGEGKRICGYGAPAKGNTLLNYCGIRCDFLDFTVDRSPHKQGLFLPGTRIPILAPDRIREARPEYVLILPWNLREEIVEQIGYIREWNGKFILPIPEPRVIL